MDCPSPIIVIDSREQRPWSFTVPSVVSALDVGDYSIMGLESRIAIERKSLSDLMGSITRGRDRFERELAKARSYDRFYVLAECSPSDIIEGRYEADVHPRAAWESIASFTVRHCPFIFGESRSVAERMCESLLVKYAREFRKAVEIMDRAAREHGRLERGCLDMGKPRKGMM
jgi:ERCC4-type nuclease